MNKRTIKLLAAAALLVVIAMGLAFFRIKAPRDIFAYVEMNAECHPVWKEFALRRVHSGDPASDFLRRFPPSRTWQQGSDTYHYFHTPCGPHEIPFTGVVVIVRGDRLIASQAASCTWRHTFFDPLGLVSAPPIGED